MTTIAYREGFLAADTRAYSGGDTPIGNKCKLFRTKDGYAIGVSTTIPGLSEQFAEWALGHFSNNPDYRHNFREKWPGEVALDALLIDPEGSVFFFSGNERPSGPLTDEFFAIGSGVKYALGAMSVGASAKEAIEVAMRHDAWTGGEVVALDLEEIATKQSDG